MSKQIFKNVIPKDVLINFLNTTCDNTNNDDNNYYLLDKNSYKRSLIDNKLTNFLQEIKPYYHASKQYYVERKLDYPKFVTIIRQVCKAHNLAYSSQLYYDKSEYNIVYHIYN